MNLFEEYGINTEKKRDYEPILYIIALLHGRLGKRLDEYFDRHGTSAPKYNILMAVTYVNGGKGLNQAQLSRHLVTTAGNITKLVDSLDREGLITRAQNKRNRRENIVRITARGRAFIERLWPQYDKLAGSMVSCIPEDKRKILIAILYDWLTQLDQPDHQLIETAKPVSK